MATKAAKYAPGGVHTAGIYSDMTVDGPEIGTLVVVIDRAKNLPNRKSMGKQDPYCAARLAKEAQKTDTDKRGGQTPRWDQELRFTVRESPDYCQLKVSVFNDDKKTELIGETWISLESILVHGGGRNDIWHNLNCKGKYAGEIRIELTYYDTRPRENHLQPRKQSTQTDGMPNSNPNKEGMAGPRQMNPTKRRPLPADPTGSSPLPSSLPQTLPSVPQRAVDVPDEDLYGAATPPHGQLQQYPHDPRHSSPLNQSYQPNQSPYEGRLDMESRNQYPSPEQFGQYGPEIDIYGKQKTLYSAQSPEKDNLDRPYTHNPGQDMHAAVPSGRYGRESHNMLPDPTGNIDPRLLNQPQHLNMSQSNFANEESSRDGFTRSPLSGQNIYGAGSSQSTQLAEGSQDNWTSGDRFTISEDEPPPPLPPTHRQSAPRSTIPIKERDPHGSLPKISPLNTRVDRGGNFPNSPPNKARTSFSSVISPMSTSPTSQQQYPSYDAVSSISSYPGPRHHRSQSPIRDSIRDREVYGDSMPPSLTPGYDPGIADEESERLIREKRMIDQQATPGPMPRYQQAAAVPIQQPRAQHVPRGFENLSNRRERREHRYSAPIPPTAPPVRSQPISPNPPAVMRKSLSPQPGSAAIERRQAEVPAQVPFGPDSFDIYNPTIGSASSINDSGAQYNTPEEAREARFQHERKQKLGDGPIIGSDGRIIDPSDHLPCDTWAPEPEQKPARKGPEVTIRFRQSPQGAQPMSHTARQPLREARPNVLSHPTAYPQSSTDTSPAAAAAGAGAGARTRLQKKLRPAVAQPHSSPVLPSSYNASPLNPTLRSSASDYPLRENPNYGGYGNHHNSSPLYGHRSAGAVPPPVPGKVPIGSGQEDWGRDELSEEMRRIDIGVGGGRAGRGGARRARYVTRDV